MSQLIGSLIENEEMRISGVYGLIPNGGPELDLEDIDTGGRFRMAESRAALSDWLKAYFNDNKPGLCVFENALYRASHPVASTLVTRKRVLLDEIYHFITAADGVADITTAIGEAEAPGCFAGFLAPTGSSSCDDPELNNEVIRRIALNTRWIITHAWDNEGYLLAPFEVRT